MSIFESSRFVAGISQETSGLGIEPDADPLLAEFEEESLPLEQALNPRVLIMARATTPAAILFFNMRNLRWFVS